MAACSTDQAAVRGLTPRCHLYRPQPHFTELYVESVNVRDFLANSKQESEPMFPPRTHSRDAFRASPEIPRDGPGSPYAWDSNGSRERLLPNSPLGSPTFDAPPPPPHRTNVAPAFLGHSRDEYSFVPDRHSTPVTERFSQDNPLAYLADHIHEKEISTQLGREVAFIPHVAVWFQGIHVR